MNNRLNQHRESLREISLLKNLDSNSLTEVLRSCKINSYKKGQLIFSKNEKSFYFYILLSGLVKIFNHNFEGKEAILQILESQEFLNNCFESSFAANAEAVEDCEVLLFSLNDFCELIKKFPQLALNLLQEISSQHQLTLEQINQLKLDDAKEKVGQFLLKSAFKEGAKKQKNFELKFNKAALASYLGIRAETLSRNLQKLKSDGEISISKNKITLLNERSLCKFCNEKIAQKCYHHQSNNCEFDKI